MRTTADRLRNVLLGTWSALAIIFLFLPIFVIVMFSFNDNQGRFNFTWQGFTLKHWKEPFAVAGLGEAMGTSILIALFTTLIAVALGTFVALALVRYRWRGRGATGGLVFLPLATPEVVLGAALLGWFLTMGLVRGFVTVLIAHVMFTLGYVVITVRARLEGMDTHIEEAAADLGAGQLTTQWKITLPLLAPG
ncbi:MAG: ABC transporter permease, partial [Solirubrobacterales bacterium]